MLTDLVTPRRQRELLFLCSCFKWFGVDFGSGNAGASGKSFECPGAFSSLLCQPPPSLDSLWPSPRVCGMHLALELGSCLEGPMGASGITVRWRSVLAGVPWPSLQVHHPPLTLL